MAYHEHPSYVALLRRAYPLWRELEEETGERLLHVTGSLDGGARDGPFVTGSLASCREHGLAHELLDAREIERRFPAFHLPDDFAGVLQPDGGYLLAERSVVAFVEAARRRGAVVRTGEVVQRFPRRRRWRRGAGRRRHLSRRGADRHRRRLGRQAAAGSRGARASGASGGGLVSTAATRAVRGRALPGVRHPVSGGQLLRAAGDRTAGLQDRPARTSSRGGRPRRTSTAPCTRATRRCCAARSRATSRTATATR